MSDDIEVPVKIKVNGAEEAKSTLKDLAKFAAEAFAVEKLISFAEKGIEEFAQMTAASNGLSAALGRQSAMLETLAATEMKSSIFKTQDIEQGYKKLAIMGLNEKQIKQMSPAMMNLAAVTGSTESAAKLLGQAYNGNGMMLAKLTGVHLPDYILKSKDAAAISDFVNKKLGEQGKAAFEAMSPLEKMSRVMDEAGAGVGEVLTPALNELGDSMDSVKEIAKDLTKAFMTVVYVVSEVFDFALLGLVDTLGVVILSVTKTIEGIVELATMVPGHPKFLDHWKDSLDSFSKGTAGVMDRFTKAASKTAEENAKKIKGLWSDTPVKKFVPTGKDGGDDGKDDETGGNGGQTEAYKKREEDKLKIQKEYDERGLSENDKKIQELSDQATKYLSECKGNAKLEEEIVETATQKIMEIQNQEAVKQKEIDDKKQAALEGFDEDSVDAETKKMDELSKQYDDDLANFTFTVQEKEKLTKAYTSSIEHESTKRELRIKKEGDETIKKAKEESDKKKRFVTNDVETTLSSLSTIANAMHASSKVKQALAIGDATVSAGKAEMGIFANSEEYIGTYGTIAGPIMMWTEAALVGAAAAAQIAEISSAKMALGGVVTGGTPGQDSVPAMLMPGEIVVNPSLPNNPTHTSNGSSTSSNNLHMYAGDIHIHGNVDQRTLSQVQEVSERAITSALRKMQVMGKFTANGLTIRN